MTTNLELSIPLCIHAVTPALLGQPPCEAKHLSIEVLRGQPARCCVALPASWNRHPCFERPVKRKTWYETGRERTLGAQCSKRDQTGEHLETETASILIEKTQSASVVPFSSGFVPNAAFGMAQGNQGILVPTGAKAPSQQRPAREQCKLRVKGEKARGDDRSKKIAEPKFTGRCWW
jgi:hypothetical protein